MFLVGTPTLLEQCTLPMPCRALSSTISLSTIIPSLGFSTELSSNEESPLSYDEFPGLDYRCSPVLSEGTIWEGETPFLCSPDFLYAGDNPHIEGWSQNRISCYGMEAPLPIFAADSCSARSSLSDSSRFEAITPPSGNGPSSFFGFDFGSAHSYQPTPRTRDSASPEHLPNLPSLLPTCTAEERSPVRESASPRVPSPRRSREPASSVGEQDHLHPRRRFPCQVAGCSRRFTSQYTLKVHMEAHKPKPRNSFPCTLGCSERFSRQHDRLRHEVAKHGKVCEFSCDECGRFFSTKKTLGNHKCPVAQGGTRWVNN